MSDKATFRARLNELSDRGCDVVDEIFDHFGITYHKGNQYYFGPCPVHNGKNRQAWVFYPHGHTVRGIWHCYSNGCHEKFGRNFINLIQGILTNQHGNKVDFGTTLRWILEFLGFQRIDDIPLPDGFIADRRLQQTRDYYFNIETNGKQKGLSRWEAREKINIASPYYLGRGFSEEILDKYDVGDISDRVVVPIYDPDYKFVIGSTSRSLHERCIKCKLWHNPKSKCPSDSNFTELINSSKWFNNNFEKSFSLYNLWHKSTKDAIRNTGRVILVEGPGDVWKLEEAGIHNGLALYGVELSDPQLMLLYENYVTEIVLLTDADDAGQHAIKILKEKLSREFTCYSGRLSAKDVGDTELDGISKIKLYNFKNKEVMSLEEYCK